MSRIKTNTSVRRLEKWTRLATARRFDGKRVRIVRKYLTEPEVMEGFVFTAALTLGGSGDVLVMRVEKTSRSDGRTDWRGYGNNGIVAVSLAQIESIEEIA